MFLVGILGFISMNILVKMNPKQWFYLSHNGLFLFTQLALIYSFLQINFNNHTLYSLIERLGKASLSIYMLHLPLISIYFIVYRLIVASYNSSNITELLVNTKNIEHLSTISVLYFSFYLYHLVYIFKKKYLRLFKLNFQTHSLGIKRNLKKEY